MDKVDSRYPHTYACDYLREKVTNDDGTILSRAVMAKAQAVIADAMGVDEKVVSNSLADKFIGADKKTTTSNFNHLALLEKWEKSFFTLEKEYNKLKDVFYISPESKMSKSMHLVFDSYTDSLENFLKDDEEWMLWYCWENDMGRKKMQAKAANWPESKPICNIQDLLSLIANQADS